MNKVANLELSELLTQAAAEQLADTKRSVVGFIKSKLQLRDVTQRDIESIQKQLEAKQKMLASLENDIQKISANDWSIVSLAEKEGKNNGND